ncbi:MULTISPECIES: hypothetical protein [unclassified Janthinobacterium]|uniref:hypothetical protein n=1 Tax=unclassified Janthinobacterium TaxID=2610881 RepID=UPI00160D985A|nr:MULTISPECIES: hypothetical protein [unclassified Janthinobacterium]MBB5371196.1 hypothetical protein [Janthinobacterium sp. K2C7]MBB5384002.1 hypothetical protein [Janthinobacterium sp. K2Li3]MBB5389176.1 hypothetical protein [Janthinobacterium sp. K2E3]
MWSKAVMVMCCSMLAVAASAAPPTGADGGSVVAVADGALIRYRGWLLALDGAQAGTAADVRLLSADGVQAAKVVTGKLKRDLPVWAAVELAKDGTRLRITSLPGLGASRPAALLLDFGAGDYRIVIPASSLARHEHSLLAQHYPGADLALLLQDSKRVMLPLGTSTPQVFGQEQAAPYLFSKMKR